MRSWRVAAWCAEVCKWPSLPSLYRPKEAVSFGKVDPRSYVGKGRGELVSSGPPGYVSEGDGAGRPKAGHRPVTRSMSGEKADARPR